MKEKKAFEIEIEGCLDVRENWISSDDFTDKFIQWVEANNWYFGGVINEYHDESNTENNETENDFDDEWPFEDSEDVAVFTTTQILKKEKPILFISHDEEDGAWQFHSGEGVNPSNAAIVSLREMLRIDQEIGSIAELPLGYTAERPSTNDNWRVYRSTENDRV